MIKKLAKYAKIAIAMALIASLALPSYATVGASDGSAFVTKAEFDAALSDFNARLTTFEAGINSKIDSQVSSYLDRNGIWNGKAQEYSAKAKDSWGLFFYDVDSLLKWESSDGEMPPTTNASIPVVYLDGLNVYNGWNSARPLPDNKGDVVQSGLTYTAKWFNIPEGKALRWKHAGAYETPHFNFIDHVSKSGLLFADICYNIFGSHDSYPMIDASFPDKPASNLYFAKNYIRNAYVYDGIPVFNYYNEWQGSSSKPTGNYLTAKSTDYGSFLGNNVWFAPDKGEGWSTRFGLFSVKAILTVAGNDAEVVDIFDWAPTTLGLPLNGIYYGSGSSNNTLSYSGVLCPCVTEPTLQRKSMFVTKNDEVGVYFRIEFGGRQPQGNIFLGSNRPWMIPAIQMWDPMVY